MGRAFTCDTNLRTDADVPHAASRYSSRRNQCRNAGLPVGAAAARWNGRMALLCGIDIPALNSVVSPMPVISPLPAVQELLLRCDIKMVRMIRLHVNIASMRTPDNTNYL